MVWTALPCLTCCFPCIGHTGICKSDGTIYDFIGSGPIHSEELAFGNPLKYLRLDNTGITDEQWDTAIDQANEEFSRTSHNLVVNNCHHHVGRALGLMNYKGKSNWSQVDVAVLATFKASHVGYKFNELSCTSYVVYLLPALLLVWLLLKLLN